MRKDELIEDESVEEQREKLRTWGYERLDLEMVGKTHDGRPCKVEWWRNSQLKRTATLNIIEGTMENGTATSLMLSVPPWNEHVFER